MKIAILIAAVVFVFSLVKANNQPLTKKEKAIQSLVSVLALVVCFYFGIKK